MKTLAASFLRRLRRIPTYAAIQGRRLGKWLRKDPWTKIGSLALAVLLFLFLHLLSPKIDNREIRIKVVADPLEGSSKIIADISATEVKATLRGPANLLQAIDPEQLFVRVKPEEIGLRVGRSRRLRDTHPSVSLKKRLIERADGVSRVLPDEVRVISFDPDDITLTLEEQCTRPFEIALPQLTGEPIIGTVTTNAIEILGSRTIEVTGPSNIVQTLYDNSVRIDTAPIDVSKSSVTFEQTVDLLPPTAIRPYIKSDMKVRVRIPIDDKTVTVAFSNILVNVAAVADGERFFSCSPTNVSVTVSGSRANVESLGEDRLATNIVALVSGDAAVAAAEEGAAADLPVRVFFRDASLYATLRLHDPEPNTVSVQAGKVDSSPPPSIDPMPDLLLVTPASGDDATGEGDEDSTAPSETPAAGDVGPAVQEPATAPAEAATADLP